MSNRIIRVPLAVDAQAHVNVGPLTFPLRSVAMAAICSPLAFLCLQLSFMPPMWRIFAGILILLLAATLGIPNKEGIWIGTYSLYHWASRLLMPSAVQRGQAKRAKVRLIGGTVQVTQPRGTYKATNKYLTRLNVFANMPELSTEAPGIINVEPGGARAILLLEGPAVSMSSEAYLVWCQQVMQWITSLECPAQFLTLMTHFDSEKAQVAFDRRVEGWPRTPLLDMERELAMTVAQQTLGLRHYVVFAPLSAGADGIPSLSRFGKMSTAARTPVTEADRVLQSAIRMSKSFGLQVTLPRPTDISELLSQTVLSDSDCMTGDRLLRIGDQYHVIMTMTQLPPNIEVGAIVEAMMRAHSRGITSLHIMPVNPLVAQKALHKRTSMLKYMAKRDSDDVESYVALQDTTNVVAAMAQRSIRPLRLALTMSVSHAELHVVEDAAERILGILSGGGFCMERITSPGFLPALALCPGCVPLARSLLLTADSVALRMIPALGTPFSDINSPFLGINNLNGAPAYFSIWTPPNHNLVIVGSSGSGKSVSAKTLLIRHLMEGVGCVVIDPDSEYQRVMQAVGGEYFELGQDAINPFAAGVGVPPDTAASRILPILSVMGGDEKGVQDGRPIRRLPDEDQGWLHSELANFYQMWANRYPNREPVMHDVVDFIETEAKARALTPREVERCRIITARLRRYTQGQRAQVFDRPSTFNVTNRPVAIGLKVFAMTYGADLTPALAVVLTSILAAVERRIGRVIVVVDEAHRVTSDPDAGEVLGQLVRQARKYGAGVWMMSQRVEDFVHTDLGRTLAATAATKLILGTEEAVVAEVKDVFGLRDEEAAAINPMQQGRGVLICGAERTIVNIVPGAAIMSLADTSAAVTPFRERHLQQAATS